ncbi:thioredoxin [Brachionus plicatilis]|uniref:Thioredoxin n=1 Tax=Brachionus plicatilis TaxID=10195 RepID=A0A3M7RH36_BRAPC|nr:thioredoxin [Brachionus plicatilis]
MAVEVKTEDEFNRLISAGNYATTIVDFTASWCPPCRAIKPYFEDLAKIYTDVQFLKVDVDNLSDVAGKAGVRSMPTFVVYKNGAKSEDILEGANKNKLNMIIQSHSSISGNTAAQSQNSQRRFSSSSKFGFLKRCTIL